MHLLRVLDLSVRSLASVISVKATRVYLPSDQRHCSQFTLLLASDVHHHPVMTKPVQMLEQNYY